MGQLRWARGGQDRACCARDRINLTKNDPQAQGQHHYIPHDMVASVEQDLVRLNLSAEQARQQVMGGGSMGRAGGSM